MLDQADLPVAGPGCAAPDWTGRPGDAGLIVAAPVMRRLVEQARHVARSKVSVLIEGESGTGKELLARLLHDAGPRRGGPFVQVNCAAFSETLIESELFGHEKGAFTGAEATRSGRFELASGGTLLLDEIGEMPLPLQAKLLRVLEEERFERLGGTRTLAVDVRLVATTNRDLDLEVARGRFRADLYYRLNGVRFVIPPLRERPEDIPPLAAHFFHRFRHEVPRGLSGLSARALARLAGHCWPGNVRELRNVLQRACLLARGPEIQPDDLLLSQARTARPAEFEGKTLAEIERAVILATLREQNGNRTATAAQLGITARTLLNKLNRYRAEQAAGVALARGASDG
ncbi:MAG: sigma-54-dependent Fis family transcriptional regulator [Gemmataceae bacterium]|nr:sigma-54-dependent Fis family transcriptional regulator [Gemmataceae bacterium]